MKILLAQNSGFCFGVRRAVDMAEAYANETVPVYTYGYIIHNEIVVEQLRKKNVFPAEDPSLLPKGTTLIVRAHGAPPSLYADCAKRGLRLIDATCPFVKRIHRVVEKAAQGGRTVLIAGKPEHPEVIGIRGWAGENALILATVTDAVAMKMVEHATLVAQTTLSAETYVQIQKALADKCADLEVFETICDTTRARQSEAIRIAKKCNKVFVLGSERSANTGKLTELCKNYCEQTITIEDINKLFLDNLQSNDIIGIVAGASTPDWMIREVVQAMSELEKTTIETIEAEAPAEEIAVTEAPQMIEANTMTVEDVVVEPMTAEAKLVDAEACPPVQKTNVEVEEPSEFAQAFEKTMTRIHNGQVIEGTVLSIVDGEVFVNVGYKSDGIIPKNEFSSDSDAKPEDYFKEGDTIDVEVVKVNDGEGNVLLSRKNVESKKLWEDLVNQEDLENKVFDAVGKEVVKGGIIADIGGIRAFVPASQASVKYIENLSEFVGQPMKLKVLEVDKQRKRIVASQKQVMLAEAAAEKHKKWETLVVGSKVNGIVRRITDFGAFVDIGGVDGLVHVTDAAWGRVKHPSDVFTIGQEIEVLILNVDIEKERVSLGYKQLQPKPWTTADVKYPVGSIVEGKVVRIVPFGAFVALESTIDGLIHISQVSVHRIAKVEDELQVGDLVRCKVLEVNTEAKRISLSRKEAMIEENPELAEQLQAEKAERDRQYAERQEQRQQQRDQSQAQRVTRDSNSGGGNSNSNSNNSNNRTSERSNNSFNDRRDRPDRHRRNEDGDYELPPVQESTTSLAALFQGLKVTDD
ncbi:MAG: bifunctional 4-hydroxy-3-methylbut-2-enyl diphosphate reductase/30S ribosomal protein S1 [Clostridia bacterium]